MNIDRITLVYFSPTGTTRKILEGIASGIQAVSVTRIDLTPPAAENPKVVEFHNELVIIGAPVYIGRIPATAVSRLKNLKANQTPVVVVVVYGNRAFEDALLELRDLTLEAGFKPVAAGAFIGEHSFNTDDTPIAVGRPVESDLKKARELGEKIVRMMEELTQYEDIPSLPVPGTHPYREQGPDLEAISPITREEQCILCGACAEVCPTAAITIGTAVKTRPEACIQCCACVKNCQAAARVMTHPLIKKISVWLSTNCRERKEPEIYLAG